MKIRILSFVNRIKKRKILLTVFLVTVMLTVSGCGSKTSSKSRSGCRKIAEEFFKNVEDSDPVTMLGLKDGKANTIYMRSGDNMYINDIAFGLEYYLFIEDGKKCVLTNGGEVYEDDFNYQLYMDTAGNTVNQFVLNNYDKDAFGEGSKVKYTANVTNGIAGNETASMIFLTFDCVNGDEKSTLEVTGISDGGIVKEIDYKLTSSAYTQDMVFIFTYDEFTIDIPEH